MLAGGVGDDGAIDLLAVEGDLLDALLLAVRMDGNLVLGVAELALDGVVAGCFGQTGVDADAVVVRLDTEDELRDGVPHPGCCTGKPRVLALAGTEGILAGYHLAVDVGLHLMQRLVFLIDV